MKRSACFIIALLLIFGAGCADTAEPAEDLQGTVYFPEGSNEQTAAYRVSYRYPQVAVQTEADEAINAFFDYLMNDMLSFTAPLFAQEAESGSGAYTTIDYRVTCSNEQYFCVLFSQEQFFGAATGFSIAAYPFLRLGDDAGMIVGLPHLLGLAAPGDHEGLAYERAAQRANHLIYELVWEIIEEEMTEPGHRYFDGLTADDLKAEFYPESDFYLDEDGNPVFFIQPAMIAAGAAGILLFPFSIDELLSEL